MYALWCIMFQDIVSVTIQGAHPAFGEKSCNESHECHHRFKSTMTSIWSHPSRLLCCLRVHFLFQEFQLSPLSCNQKLWSRGPACGNTWTVPKCWRNNTGCLLYTLIVSVFGRLILQQSHEYSVAFLTFLCAFWVCGHRREAEGLDVPGRWCFARQDPSASPVKKRTTHFWIRLWQVVAQLFGILHRLMPRAAALLSNLWRLARVVSWGCSHSTNERQRQWSRNK